MQKLLTNWLKRPVSFIVLNLVIVILGVVSLINLPLELSPSLEFPKVTIYTFYPNSTPEMIGALVTSPIESRVQQAPNIKGVSSVSSKNNSQVNITFQRNAHMKFATFQLNEILADYKPCLTPYAFSPHVLPTYSKNGLYLKKYLLHYTCLTDEEQIIPKFSLS